MKNNTMTNQSNIERVVMRRVHTIRVLRPLVSLGALSALVFVIALWGIGKEVWVARIFENMSHASDPASFSRFWFVAFDHTRFVVQALSFLTFAAFAYLARETVRLISSVFIPIRA